jgi:hypothetical protein
MFASRILAVATAIIVLTGCAGMEYAIPVVGPGLAMKDSYETQRAHKFQQMIASEPDLPEWQQARENITLAMGDRDVSMTFDDTYKATVVGIATMEVTVNNMERESGFIAASGRILPTELATATRKQRLRDYAVAKGMSAEAAEPTRWMDPGMMSSYMEEATTMTITILEMAENESRVKVRFNNVYYPQELEESYRFFWQALDKQGFMDQALDQ